MATPAYYLWLKPPAPSKDLLAETIVRLARELGSPVFDPHMTLAGPLHGSAQELVDRGERLCTLLSSFRIVLDEPLHGPDYFRCVFMRAVSDTALTRANEMARRVFELPERPFMPHVSLLYGNFPADERQRIVNDLPASLRLTFVADTFDLMVLNSLAPEDWLPVRSWRFADAPC